ncbi:MAG: hypothetical protein FWD69_08185 [Polyangiaceae bacterium]|nr:hypothetical protein [Polyangiaceae bacterium]
MSRLELSGLVGSHPLGALAAFGLLRLLSREEGAAHLSFVERDDWTAVLDSRFETMDDLIAFLVEWSSRGIPTALSKFGEEDVRVDPEKFRGWLCEALSGDTEDLGLASFLVALAAYGAEDKSKHLIKPSPFYMASGQQSFVNTLRRIHMCAKNPDVWREALCGPWTYATEEWGAGWDPGSERLHALRAQAPTKDKTTCVAGAVRLAFEALPLFPTFSIRQVVHTVGWVERQRLDRFRWPIFSVPISVESLGVLLASGDVLERDDMSNQRRDEPLPPLREGIAAIYESVRHEFGQGYAVFRPSRRLA